MLIASLPRPKTENFGKIYDTIKTYDYDDIEKIEITSALFNQLRYEVIPPYLRRGEKYYFTYCAIAIKENTELKRPEIKVILKKK